MSDVKDRLQQLLIESVRESRRALGEATDQALLQWWREHPMGGKVYISNWRYEGHLWACICAGPSAMQQAQSSPGDGAEWISCTGFDLPCMN